MFWYWFLWQLRASPRMPGWNRLTADMYLSRSVGQFYEPSGKARYDN